MQIAHKYNPDYLGDCLNLMQSLGYDKCLQVLFGSNESKAEFKSIGRK